MNKNMSDTLPVICENAGRTIEVAMGTTLLEVERQLRLDGPHPFLAAYVNNRIKELNYRIYKPVTVRFIDITSFEGIRVYQRTISFILQKAVRCNFVSCRQKTSASRPQKTSSKPFFITARRPLTFQDISRMSIPPRAPPRGGLF